MASSPTAAFSFDEGKGEFARDSAGNHDAAIHGATWTGAGKYGSALEFDGEEDIVTIPASKELDFTEGFTLEAWVRPSESHSWASLLAREDSESPPFSYLLYAQGGGEAPVLYMDEGELELTHNDGETALPLNTWSHLAVTSDGEHSRIYIDGELDSVGPALPVKAADGALQIGGNEVFGEHFAGRIDEVRLYGEALGAEEIEEDRDTAIEEPPPAALPSTISSNLTLTPAGGPYTGSTVTINEGVTVTVKRGTVIKLDGTLYVNGSLNLNGTKDDPIFITSLKDDSVGGDTNEDGSATHPEPGDWRDIEFTSSSTGNIKYAHIRYGGWSGVFGDFTTVAVKCPCASPPTISHSVITHNLHSGVSVFNGSPVISSNSITDNGGMGITVETGGAPEIVENTISENGDNGINVNVGEGHHASINIDDNVIEENNGEAAIRVTAGTAFEEIDSASLGGNTIKNNSGKAVVYETFGTTNPEYHSNPTPPNITTNKLSGNAENGIWIAGAVNDSTKWEDNGYPLVVFNNGLTVSKEATLTLGAGLAIKNEFRSIYVAGTLNAEGTSKDPVILTSYRDDSVEGDTNGDGVSSAEPGDWAILEFIPDEGSPPTASTLSHMEVLYGGLKIYPFTSMVNVKCPCANAPTFTESVFSHSVNTAIYANGGSPQFIGNTITHNLGEGIAIETGGAPKITENNVAENGGTGISFNVGEGHQAWVDINDNLVAENTQGGISVWAGTAFEEIESASLGGNEVKDNGGKAISYTTYGTSTGEYHSNPIPSNITTNVLSGNKENGIWVAGAVKTSTTWKDSGYPLVVHNNGVTVSEGSTLTLGSGLVLKNEFRSIYVAGTLNSEGTAKNPVTLTSYRDDSVGGDTNGDGSASGPAPGDWASLQFTAHEGGEATGSALDGIRIAYGGESHYPFDSMVEVKCPCPHAPRFQGSLFARSYGETINFGGDPGPTVDGKPPISHSIFRDIPGTAIAKSGTATLFAPYNDFGCDSGPKPYGCGAPVGEHIDPTPWAGSGDENGNCHGKKTQCPKGADPVSLATGELDYQHRDLLLTNKSKIPLEFSRGYNSGDSSDSGLGPGWSHSGLISATELESGDVLIRRSDGHEDVFTAAEGGYEAPSGVSDALVENESGTFTLTTREQAIYDFDETGRIATITDDHGLVTTYGYNESGRLATITDPSGQTLAFSYNESNHITKVTDSTGREVKFGYSEAGDLETVTDALGGVTKYGYDSNHRLLTITDPRENVILENIYDGQGRIVEQLDGLKNLWEIEYKPGETVVTQPEGGESTYKFDGEDRVTSEANQDGHTTTIGYDGDGNVNRIEKPGGAVWELEYDPAGNLTSAVDPEEGERSFAYDAHNHIESYTDPREETWEYEWSAGNDLEKIIDPAEGETTLTYNPAGEPLSVTDPNEHTTEFEYDARGNRIAEIDPLEDETSFEYNARNYLISKAEPGLKPEEFGRDSLGDMLSRTTPEGNETEYEYDANGLVTEVIDPAKKIWQIERNAMERPTAYIDPVEQRTEIGYDGNLNPTSVTDRRGKETTYGYDPANQLERVQLPEGGVWEIGYDARGNRDSVTDPDENTTAYEYDLLDRMVESSEPLSALTKFEYDPAGDLTSFTDPRGKVTEFAYDPMGRLEEVDQPLGKTTSFTYDGVGNRKSRTTALGTLEYAYDPADRLEEISEEGAPLRTFGYDEASRLTAATDAEEKTLEIGYDDDGRAISLDDGRGESVSREFNSRGNLVSQEDGRGTTSFEYNALDQMESLTDPQSQTIEFGYDPDGHLEEVDLPNGIVTSNVYDGDGRLSKTTSMKGATTVESLSYEYDPAGNRLSQTDRLSQKTSYEYDALNRLSKFDPPGPGSTSYEYDSAGNRTKAGATTYEYNALNQLTEASDGSTYAYDEAGRMIETAKGALKTTYGWDPLDELASVDDGTQEINYSYDGLGRRSVRTKGAAVQVAHYGDLSDNPILDTDGEEKSLTSYLGAPGGLVEQRSAGVTSYPLADAHGDITTMTKATGEVESRQTYDPWGAQLSGPSLEMGYLGAQQRRSDPTTGLIQMGERPYDPSLGAFAREDPVLGHIGEGASLNHYPYAWDNPLNRYDLNGRDVCVPTPFGDACAEDAAEDVAEGAEDIAGTGEEAVSTGWDTGGEVAGAAGSGINSAWDWTAPGRSWFGDRASDFVKFVEKNWDTAVIGTATVGIGIVTVGGTILCIGATDGIETLDCLKGAAAGYTATVGGAYATYESTRN